MAAESTAVLLGVCDSPCREPCLSPFENKMGGYPDFFSSLSSLPRCTLCGVLRRLVLQIYCPLEGSANHRLLHVYCCPTSSCSRRNERWLVHRSEMMDFSDSTKTAPQETTIDHSEPLETTTVSGTTTTVSTNEWCTGADEWGDDNEAETTGDKILKLTQTVEDGLFLRKDEGMQATQVEEKILNPSSNKPLTEPYFKSMYINVTDEPLSLENTDLQQRAEALLQTYKKQNDELFFDDFEKREKRGKCKGSGGGGGGSKGGSEKYEKTVAKHGDRIFQKFQKKLSLCPSQVLRYCRGGKPLLISDSMKLPQPDKLKCKTCGAPAVFELQLMPSLLYFLRLQSPAIEPEERGDSSSGLEFGTILVYSCSESCWSEKSSFREELAIVIPDPESEILKKISSKVLSTPYS